jgi:hypothetical protein
MADDVVGSSVRFAERAHERALRAPEPTPGNLWGERTRAAHIEQTAETLRRARASARTDPSGNPR